MVQLAVLCGPGRPLEAFRLLARRPVEERVAAALRQVPAPVLGEDLGLVLAAGKEPALERFQFALPAEAGLFDRAPVAAGWRLRSIPRVAAALRARYRPVETVGPYEIWEPAATSTGSAPGA